MVVSQIFDIEHVIQHYDLPRDMVEQILQEVREEFQGDELMYELHAVRAIQAAAMREMTPEQMVRSINSEADRILDEHGLERMTTPTEDIPRIHRRSTA